MEFRANDNGGIDLRAKPLREDRPGGSAGLPRCLYWMGMGFSRVIEDPFHEGRK